MNMEFIGLQLESIARSLERIANYFESVPSGVPSSDYAAAVQAIVDMPDDIPAEPVKEAEPVTKADVVAALNAHARAYSIDSGKKILNSFAPRLDEVPAEKYAALVALLKQGPSV